MTEIDEASVRAEIRAWLEANWNPDYGLVEWRKKLAECGWGVPHWPSRWYGRDLRVGLVPVVDATALNCIGAIGVAKVVDPHPGCCDHPRAWHRLAEGEVSSPHFDRRGHLVPVVQ